ncbi:transposase [Thermoanaerobacter mathranii]
MPPFSSKLEYTMIEGCKNKIKVFKRNAYGYHNFYRFKISI